MKKEEKKQRKISVLMIFTLLVVLAWVWYSLYQAFNKQTLPEIYQQQLVPFEPTFDQQTMEALKNRKKISEEELDKVPEITQYEVREKSATSPARMMEVKPSPGLSPTPTLQPTTAP